MKVLSTKHLVSKIKMPFKKINFFSPIDPKEITNHYKNYYSYHDGLLTNIIMKKKNWDSLCAV